MKTGASPPCTARTTGPGALHDREVTPCLHARRRAACGRVVTGPMTALDDHPPPYQQPDAFPGRPATRRPVGSPSTISAGSAKAPATTWPDAICPSAHQPPPRGGALQFRRRSAPAAQRELGRLLVSCMWPSRSVPKTTGTPSPAPAALPRCRATAPAPASSISADQPRRVPRLGQRGGGQRGAKKVPSRFICHRGPSIRLPCSMLRTPVCTAWRHRARRIGVRQRVEVGRLASLTAARNSSTENWVPSIGSVGC